MSNRKYDDTEFKIHGAYDKKIVTEHAQDCEGIIKSVKELRETVGNRETAAGYHAARIPRVLLMKWGQEDANDQLAYLQGRHNKDPELAKKLAVRLNSNEFNQFRIWNGNVASSDMLKEGKKT